jgi:tetratricopeptide (TPR) repeat protein
MSSARNLRTRLPIAVIFLAICCAPFPLAAFSLEHQANSQTVELSKMLSFAESQHEIVLILIRKKEFSQALTEANKIFELGWPPDKEMTLRKDLLYFADQFLHCGQAALGVQLLDTNLKTFKSNANRAAILKEEGYLLKSMNQGDKALACFREAQRLENSEKQR